MDTLTRDELKSLATEQHALCVSLYHPLHRRHPHIQQNQTKLRDALDEAQLQLAKRGLTDREIQRLLKPAHELFDRSEFWQPGGARGLALLVADEGNGSVNVSTFRLPYSVPESVDVGNRYHVTPLVRLLDWNAEFYLLALGQNSVRLFACNNDHSEMVPLPDKIPGSFQEFTAETDVGRPTQFRLSAGKAPGRDQTAIVHGQTSYKDEHKARVEEFVSHIGKQMNHWLLGQRSPLVLAAVARYHPIFQDACPSPQLVTEGVHGSSDELSDAELNEKAIECITHWGEQRSSDFSGRFVSRMAHGHASSELESIVPSAAAGRVESLLIADAIRVWGRFEPNQSIAIVNDEQSAGDCDLLDLAVAETLAHGGEVHATASGRVPDGSAAAALLRW